MYALNLTLPFETEYLDLAKRECDLKQLQQFRIPKEAINEKLLALLDKHDIGLTHAEAFFTPPKTLLPIHVDGPEMNNIAKLNWCWGAEGSKMLWWKLKPGIQPELKVTNIGTRYLTMQAKDCITVHQAQIGKPTLVNVGKPHSVFNMTNEGRWVLSLVLWDKIKDEALQFEEASNRLSSYAGVNPSRALDTASIDMVSSVSST